MIIDFQFGNFRSFRELQSFSMRAAHKRKNDKGMDEKNVFESTLGIRMLKTKAIYGSNASGKSNIAKAFLAFRVMVKSSVVQEKLTKKIWSDKFGLNEDTDTLPMTFQLIFSMADDIYRFGFQIKNEKIESEWLFRTQANQIDSEEQYFFRQQTDLVYNEKYFAKDSSYLKFLNSNTNEIFRSDALFITSVAINGNKALSKIREEILKIITIDGTNSDTGLRLALQIIDNGDPKEKEALKNFIKYADTGIHDFSLADLPSSQEEWNASPLDFFQDKSNNLKSLVSFHRTYSDNNKPLKKLQQDNFFKWESKGSIKLLGMAAIILRTLKSGQALLIDEFDSSLHPNLTLKILNIFNSNITNPNNAQLIVITHDVGLMRGGKLRRDQIVMVNKDIYGRSSLKTLIEYKGIRKDQSFEKEYLEGSYAGIPNLVKLDSSVLDFLNQK